MYFNAYEKITVPYLFWLKFVGNSLTFDLYRKCFLLFCYPRKTAGFDMKCVFFLGRKFKILGNDFFDQWHLICPFLYHFNFCLTTNGWLDLYSTTFNSKSLVGSAYKQARVSNKLCDKFQSL